LAEKGTPVTIYIPIFFRGKSEMLVRDDNKVVLTTVPQDKS
jgi:hypothetical protein